MGDEFYNLLENENYYEIEKMISENKISNIDNEDIIILLSTIGNEEILKLLLNNNLIEPDIYNNILLILATKYNHKNFIKVLLENENVNPNDQNDKAILNSLEDIEIFEILINDIKTSIKNLNLKNIKFRKILKERISRDESIDPIEFLKNNKGKKYVKYIYDLLGDEKFHKILSDDFFTNDENIRIKNMIPKESSGLDPNVYKYFEEESEIIYKKRKMEIMKKMDYLIENYSQKEIENNIRNRDLCETYHDFNFLFKNKTEEFIRKVDFSYYNESLMNQKKIRNDKTIDFLIELFFRYFRNEVFEDKNEINFLLIAPLIIFIAETKKTFTIYGKVIRFPDYVNKNILYSLEEFKVFNYMIDFFKKEKNNENIQEITDNCLPFPRFLNEKNFDIGYFIGFEFKNNINNENILFLISSRKFDYILYSTYFIKSILRILDKEKLFNLIYKIFKNFYKFKIDVDIYSLLLSYINFENDEEFNNILEMSKKNVNKDLPLKLIEWEQYERLFTIMEKTTKFKKLSELKNIVIKLYFIKSQFLDKFINNYLKEFNVNDIISEFYDQEEVLEHIKITLNLFTMPKDSFTWQRLCHHKFIGEWEKLKEISIDIMTYINYCISKNDSFIIKKLKNIKTYNVFDFENVVKKIKKEKNKENICKFLTEYKEFFIDNKIYYIHNCENDMSLMGDDLCFIPEFLLIKYHDDGFEYCFTIDEIDEIIKSNKNPYTVKELNEEFIENVKERMPEINNIKKLINDINNHFSPEFIETTNIKIRNIAYDFIKELKIESVNVDTFILDNLELGVFISEYNNYMRFNIPEEDRNYIELEEYNKLKKDTEYNIYEMLKGLYNLLIEKGKNYDKAVFGSVIKESFEKTINKRK